MQSHMYLWKVCCSQSLPVLLHSPLVHRPPPPLSSLQGYPSSGSISGNGEGTRRFDFHGY